MTLSANTARCDGGKCPSKNNCRRYTERTDQGDYILKAALWVRREAGANACDMVLWINPVTTFKGD